MRLKAVAVLLFAAVPVLAQTVTGTLQDVPGTTPADAFDIKNMGGYHPSVLYKDDVFAMYYHGSAPRNLTTNDPYAGGWEWAIPCNHTNDVPQAGYNECNDRVFFAWKHLSCAAGGACGSNNLWNVYPHRGNYPAMDYFNSGGYNGAPSPSGVRTMVNWSTGGTFTYPYLPHTVGSVSRTTYGGAGYPSVIYARGRYFGIFDVIVGGDHSVCPGQDTHRMAWGHSSDGVTWTFAGLIYRDVSETWSHCQGAYVQQLVFDENTSTFYAAFTSLSDSRIYLMKAPYSSTAPYFTSWKMPVADANGNWSWSFTVPNYRTSGSAPPVDPRTKAPLIKPSQLCDRYAPNVGLAKVYKSNSPTETQYNWILLLDITDGYNDPTNQLECGNVGLNYPLRLYASDTLEKTHNVYTDITAARNTSRLQATSEYGWFPQFVWVVPNATYTRQYNPVTLFVNYSETVRGRNKNMGRVQLRLNGGIYTP